MSNATDQARSLAEAVRATCLDTARLGYERATLTGLCHAGAMAVSLDAIHSVNIERLMASERLDKAEALRPLSSSRPLQFFISWPRPGDRETR